MMVTLLQKSVIFFKAVWTQRVPYMCMNVGKAIKMITAMHRKLSQDCSNKERLS
jgi:branched-subunit amino acid transport protein AzlD